jgi:hypothetical protein
VVHFATDGSKLGEIDLQDQYAQSIFDVDARTGTIWISWANLDLGIYKLQSYQTDGTRLIDYDLPESIWQDPGYLSHGIAVVDNGEVIMELDLGNRFIRVVDASGQPDATQVDGWTYYGRTYRPQAVADDWTRKSFFVDGQEISIEADPGAFALESTLIPGPTPGSFFITRYSVFPDGTFHWNVEHRAKQSVDDVLHSGVGATVQQNLVWTGREPSGT